MGRTGRSCFMVASVVSLMVAGCDAGGESSHAEPAAYSESMPPVGEEVTFYAYTHCGVEHVRIGGHWWQAEEPLASDDGASRPPGWDDPYQEGRLTVQSPQRAVFKAHGDEVVFVRIADDAEPPGCR